jgi:hypothetical protein
MEKKVSSFESDGEICSAGRRRTPFGVYVWVSFCRGWCRITLPFPSTNSTHVECTRKPSYTLSHTHTHRKKLGEKTGRLRFRGTSVATTLVNFCPPSSLWWPPRLFFNSSPFLTFFSLPRRVGDPRWLTPLSICSCMMSLYRPIQDFVWGGEPTGNSSTSWQERTHHLQMILQLIYLFGEILFVFLAYFFWGGCLEVQHLKLTQVKLDCFFKKVTGSIRWLRV